MPIFSRHQRRRETQPEHDIRRHHTHHSRSVGDRLIERSEKDTLEYLKLHMPFSR
ncbi:MAG: hypothetical protein L0G23_06505 [Ruaniaceae bacterium]|nr:hypothetical protein [Ruaniaceae bacterium]